jgi:Protein of unknown function (DUF2950)
MKDVLQQARKFWFIALLSFTVGSLSSAALAQSDKQQTFPSCWQAAHALVMAVKSDNEAELLRVLGPDSKTLVSSGDPQEDANNRHDFVERYEQAHRLVKEPNGRVMLYIGAENWPFPIPIVEANSRWSFDTAVGKDEILMRRVGKNELSAIEICHQLVEAQKEHYAGAHPGEKGLYARYFTATSGEHDGLYHPVQSGRPEIGPLLADAAMSGAGQRTPTPFHGYYFRMLEKQGSNAAGGAKNYIVDGKMSGGFAVVAYPAEYKSTGVMTFIVNQDGTVYEKDLGPDTTKLAQSMSAFNPDSSWVRAEQ